MKVNLSSTKLFLCILMLMSNYTVAGTMQVGPKKLDSISIIGNTAFGHQAGNLEIKVTDGLGNPAGVSCDQNYVTTKNTSPNFNQMVSVLLAAQLAGKSVTIGITDDAALTAFGGRCSLVSVSLVN